MEPVPSRWVFSKTNLAGIWGIWRAPTGIPANFYTLRGHSGTRQENITQCYNILGIGHFLQDQCLIFLGETPPGHPQMPCRCPVKVHPVPLQEKASTGHLQMPGQTSVDAWQIFLTFIWGIAWPVPLTEKNWNITTIQILWRIFKMPDDVPAPFHTAQISLIHQAQGEMWLRHRATKCDVIILIEAPDALLLAPSHLYNIALQSSLCSIFSILEFLIKARNTWYMFDILYSFV